LNSVCADAQVFRKNCVNSSVNDQQKGRWKAPFSKVPHRPDSPRILSTQLTLRELERFARLGAAVLLALDHARVAGEKAAFFRMPRRSGSK
jgi:hypothetical protein